MGINSFFFLGGSVCAVMPQNSTLTLSCGIEGGVIQSITFASFGTAVGMYLVLSKLALLITKIQGKCGGFSYNKQCHAPTTMQIVHKHCISKNKCSIPVTDEVFGNPCYGVAKYLSIQAVCSNMQGIENEPGNFFFLIASF